MTYITMNDKMPNPAKAVYLGKRGRLPEGMKTCTINVGNSYIPELLRGHFFYDGCTFVPLTRYYNRPTNKRGPNNGRKVTYKVR